MNLNNLDPNSLLLKDIRKKLSHGLQRVYFKTVELDLSFQILSLLSLPLSNYLEERINYEKS